MAKRCVPCMSDSIKEVIRKVTDDPQTLRQIDAMPVCPTGEIMNLCSVGKSGRPRSAYQEFISECMKSKPIKGKPFGEAAKYMKECSAQWQEQKGK